MRWSSWGEPRQNETTTTDVATRRSAAFEGPRDENGIPITIKEAMVRTIREKVRQYKRLPRHRRAAFGFSEPGCFEVGFGSFGPAIEDFIVEKLGVSAHVKFCWRDTKGVKCVDKDDQTDSSKWTSTVEDPSNNDRSKHPTPATLKNPGALCLSLCRSVSLSLTHTHTRCTRRSTDSTPGARVSVCLCR